MFLPQTHGLSLTLTQNNRQSCTSVYLESLFWITNWKTKDSALNDKTYSLLRKPAASSSKCCLIYSIFSFQYCSTSLKAVNLCVRAVAVRSWPGNEICSVMNRCSGAISEHIWLKWSLKTSIYEIQNLPNTSSYDNKHLWQPPGGKILRCRRKWKIFSCGWTSFTLVKSLDMLHIFVL